jgi:DNA-binding response OmpR family regulator
LVSTSPGERCIAVLDDDVKFIRLVERLLGTERIRVQPITTLDLDEAIRVVRDSRCSGALVDIYMYGDAAGFALIEKLRQNEGTADLPVVVTSGAHRELGRRADFLQEHRCGVLLKPFAIDDLMAKVKSMLNGESQEAGERVARGKLAFYPRTA